MIYADIHNHALFGVDDGAKTEEEMLAMVEKSYQEGVRFLCLTPHFHPGYFGDNRDNVLLAFEKLCQNAHLKWPELKLGLGNELRYDQGCVSWLRDGQCMTMNETNYVLVDFFEREEAKYIHQALNHLLNAGYIPILAHAERYSKLKKKDIHIFRKNGVFVQVDTQALFRDFGFTAQQRCKSLLKAQLVDFMGSDAHDLSHRPPGGLVAFSKAIKKICTDEYVQAISCKNAQHTLFSGASIMVDASIMVE